MVIPLKERLIGYMERLTGEPPHLNPVADSKLPLFLRERYKLFSTRLFGEEAVVALESGDWESTSPGQYAKFAEDLSMQLGRLVILVLPKMTADARNRMVRMSIPFIVPGSQTFLPGRMVDLGETFPLASSKHRETFSPAAQCTLLYHLLYGSLERTPLKEIAEKTRYNPAKEIAIKGGYSPMMITKVKNEFEAAGIARAVQHGRSMVLEFAAAGRNLWEQAKPRLLSPVKKTVWVRWEKAESPALLAGISALSLKTMIADDRLPTYAIAAAMLRDFLSKKIFTECHYAEEATAKLELWSYFPELLGVDRSVDPLSLYLSLQNSKDERVAQQLEKLIEEVSW